MALTLIAFIVPAASAHAATAGDEYLPQLPSSGASASSAGTSGGAGSGTTTSESTGASTPEADDSSQQTREAHKPAKKGERSNRHQAVTLASDSGGGGGHGSGSILLSPLVIAMIAAVVAAAVGMTLSRRQGDHEGAKGERRPKGGRLETDGPRTPDGEIIAGPDQAT